MVPQSRETASDQHARGDQRIPAERAVGRARVDTVIFDIGGVIVDWSPEHLYRSVVTDPARREWFLTNICSPAWNAEQDRGRPFPEAVKQLSETHPEWAELIEMYWTRWPEMLGGLLPGMSELLTELAAGGTPLYAITNWSRETFPMTVAKYPVLELFADVLVSGECRLIKPDPQIFQLALNRFGVAADRCVFIDDNPVNVSAANAAGISGIRFATAPQLRSALADLGLLPDDADAVATR